LLSMICAEQGLPFGKRSPEDFNFYYYQDQIDVLLQENVRVISFTFGCFSDEITAALKSNGIILIGTATSVAEVEVLSKAAVDSICIQGIEAGGHRGTFLDGDLPQIDLLTLLSQSAEVTDIPLIAAGGIYDAKTMKAALDLGAQCIQIGSLFITADESAAAESYKQALMTCEDITTKLTKAISGRWARGIPTELMQLIDAGGLKIPYYTYQNALTGTIRSYAQKNNIAQFSTMWAGESAGESRKGTTKEIATYLIEELLKNSC
jgi:nitronate monooxygenase